MSPQKRLWTNWWKCCTGFSWTPQSHQLRSRNRSPEKLETLGDHLLRRRLALKLLQRQVAAQLGVNKATIHNWECNPSTSNPESLSIMSRLRSRIAVSADW